MLMEKLSLSEQTPGGEESNTVDNKLIESTKEDASDTKSHSEEQDGGNLGEAAIGSPSKKKRKPKKKAKKLVAPPTVLAAEGRLPWSLASSARLGRHALAKRDISPGDLVLIEAPVAAVVRSQFVKTVCHTCYRELPALAPPGSVPDRAAAAPNKQYCSRACALADTLAAVTNPIHAKIDKMAVETQVDPQLLRLILELDSKRATSAPPGKPTPTPEGTWVLKFSRSATQQSSAGEPSTAAGTQKENGAAASGSADAGREEGGVKGSDASGGQKGGDVSEASTEGGSEQAHAAEVDGSDKPGSTKAGQLEAVHCTLEDMETLTSPWDKSPEAWRKSVRAGCEALQQAIIAEGAYQPGSLQQLLDMAAVINNNAHGMGAANSTNTDSALGLYPALSMLNHSCLPNCVFASCGSDMHVRAIRPVAAGEQLTVTYINIMEPRRIRARELMDTKHFACACERCVSPLETHPDRFLEAVKCGAGGCDGWLLEQRADNLSEGDTWKCTVCATAVPSRSVDGRTGPQDITESFRAAWHQAANILRYKGHAAGRPVFEAVLARAEGVLHPMHVSAFDSLMPLVNCCRSAGDGAGASRHLARMLDTMETVCGLPTVEVGNLYDLLGKMLADRANSVPAALRARAKKQAKEAWARALAVWAISLGEKHEKCDDLRSRMKLLR